MFNDHVNLSSRPLVGAAWPSRNPLDTDIQDTLGFGNRCGRAASLLRNRRQGPSFHLPWEVRSPTWLPCSSMDLHGSCPSLGCWDLGRKCSGRSGFVLCSDQLHFPGLALFLLFPRRDPGSCPMIPVLKPYISQTIPPGATLEPHSHLLKSGQDFPHSCLEPIHNCGPILGTPLLFSLPFFGPWSPLLLPCQHGKLQGQRARI